MSSEWPIVTIESVCDLIVDCVNKTAPLSASATPFRMIRTTNVRHGYIDLSSCRYVDEDTFEKWTRRAKLKRGDVILTREAPIGEVGLVTENEGVFLGQRLMQYRANREKLDPRFLLYAFLSPYLKQQFGSHEGSGSVVSHIRVGDCSKFKIPLPPLNIQKEIASLLGGIDDRITLLHETKKTLESIAQAIFKSWFVDFDPVRAKMEGRQPEGMDEATAALFPDSFEESELRLVPKGWQYSSMADVSTVGIGKTPPRKEQHWFSENSEDIAWVSIRDMGEFGTYTSDTKEYLTQEAVDKFNIKKVPSNSVLMSFKMTIGRIAITERELTTNEAIAHFKLDQNSSLSSEYIYLSLKSFDFTQLSSTSSIADAVNSKTVRQIPVLNPAKPILLAFQENISALFERIKNIAQQTRNLELIRNTLLPRLISGQLRLPEAQEQLENA